MAASIVRDYASSDIAFVGILFSADYCKWCKDFAPLMLSGYVRMKELGVEIVLIASDKTKDAHDDYVSQFPWKSTEYEDYRRSELRTTLGITTIPALVFVDREGNCIEPRGRDVVAHLSERTNRWESELVHHLRTANAKYDSADEDF